MTKRQPTSFIFDKGANQVVQSKGVHNRISINHEHVLLEKGVSTPGRLKKIKKNKKETDLVKGRIDSNNVLDLVIHFELTW